MAAAAEHCEPEALTHAKISLSSPNFIYILGRHIHMYIHTVHANILMCIHMH